METIKNILLSIVIAPIGFIIGLIVGIIFYPIDLAITLVQKVWGNWNNE